MLKPQTQQVSVARMTIYSVIPFLSIYAGWRIEKFWVLTGINVAVSTTAVAIITYLSAGETPLLEDQIMIEPIFVITQIVISVLMVRYFAIRYNNAISMQ